MHGKVPSWTGRAQRNSNPTCTAAYEVPLISVSDAPLAGADVDLLIIPIAEDHVAAAAQRFDAPLGDDLRSAIERGEFRGKPHEIYVAPAPAAGWRAARVVFVGGGPRADLAVERFRRMAAAAAHTARNQKRARIGWADIEPGSIAAAARLEAIAEGLVVANFDNGLYKSRNDHQMFVREAVLSFVGGGRRVRRRRTRDGRVGQRRARADQRARQLLDAARAGRSGRRPRIGGRD